MKANLSHWHSCIWRCADAPRFNLLSCLWGSSSRLIRFSDCQERTFDKEVWKETRRASQHKTSADAAEEDLNATTGRANTSKVTSLEREWNSSEKTVWLCWRFQAQLDVCRTQHRLCCWSLPGSHCQSDTESFSTLTLMTEVLSGISPEQKADGALRTWRLQQLLWSTTEQTLNAFIILARWHLNSVWCIYLHQNVFWWTGCSNLS